jgi:2-polyprenyl-6-methoxyphenol hydroxylase-like FAD-dependent oxidoreductase
MPIAGSRVAVIGGSIAGCAVAIALTRAGCDVTVFERTSGSLHDRGFGIGLPPDTLGQMVAADYVDASIPAIRATTRLFVIRGGAPARLVGRLAGPAAARTRPRLPRGGQRNRRRRRPERADGDHRPG